MSLSGNPLDFLLAFLGGIAVSFTPCVYPLIPISVSYIGLRSSGSKLKGLSLGLVYVTGIAVTYAALGLLASLTGTVFGLVAYHPLTYIFVGALIIIFGLSMLDLFAIPLPHIAKLPALKKRSFLSTFILGVSSGLVASPCLTPVLGSILAYLATKKNVLYGATLLFCFAYGMGFVLIVAGIGSSALINMPKLGKWMLYIKRALAFLLMGMAIYFIYTGIRRI